jgi:putative ABC transport system ATP-binding protein
MAESQVIQVSTVYKSFLVGNQVVPVLKDVTFEVDPGDFIIILGPSGCGKSTLLHTILGLEAPTSGSVSMLGVDLYTDRTEDFRSDFRKNHVGMVYQQPNWIRSLSVEENVAFPLQLLGMYKEQALKIAREKLGNIGMQEWATYIPTELSGGQQQKVSLARAIVADPEIIIADEPTGNLDFQSGNDVMNLFTKLNQEQNKTIMMVTHDLDYIPYAKKVVNIFDGQIAGIYSDKDKYKLLDKIQAKRKVYGDIGKKEN